MVNKNKQNNKKNKSENQKGSKQNRSKPRTVVKYVERGMSNMRIKDNSFLGNVGMHAGNAISKIFGLGAYTVEQNSLWSAARNKQVPHMQSNNESLIFRHREYIGDISTSTSFVATTYNVNPGLDSTFPYLSAMARNFQEYKFRGLVFEFKSTSATAVASTNTALGTIVLAAQYRADASTFVNKQQMLNEMWSVDGKPCDDILLPIECSPTMTPVPIQYIRYADLLASQDPKFFDLCKVTVATTGSQAAAVAGELWVSYEVEFHKPTLSSGLAKGANCLTAAMVGVDNTHWFGTSLIPSFNSLGSYTSTANTIVFGPGMQGCYLLIHSCLGAAGNCAPPNITLTNGSGVNLFNRSVTTPYAPTAIVTCTDGTNSNTFACAVAFKVHDPTLSVTLGFSSGTGLVIGTISHTTLLITQLNSDIV